MGATERSAAPAGPATASPNSAMAETRAALLTLFVFLLAVLIVLTN